MSGMRETTLSGWNYLIRSDAEDVIKALQKHSFMLKDPELWRAANRLNEHLHGLKDFEESGFTRKEVR